MIKNKVALHIRAGMKGEYVSEVWVSPENGKTFTLDELQGYVGGNIEILKCGDQLLVVNEEGKLKDLPLNKRATALYNDTIVGDVLLTDKHLIR